MNPFKTDIEKLEKKELESLLQKLDLYRELQKSLGSRWEDIFRKIQTGKKTYVVEYFPSADKNFIEEQALNVYKNIFSIENIQIEDIQFEENEEILWGMRVFVDDKVLDLSYLKIENQFSK